MVDFASFHTFCNYITVVISSTGQNLSVTANELI